MLRVPRVDSVLIGNLECFLDVSCVQFPQFKLKFFFSFRFGIHTCRGAGCGGLVWTVDGVGGGGGLAPRWVVYGAQGWAVVELGRVWWALAGCWMVLCNGHCAISFVGCCGPSPPQPPTTRKVCKSPVTGVAHPHPFPTPKRAYLKSERFYFPALGHRPVSENNLFVFCVSRPPRVGLCTART